MKIIYTLLLLIASTSLFAQRFDWVSFTPVVNGNANNSTGALASTVDDEGNIYTVVFYSDALNVGGTTVQNLNNNLLITKWNPNGEVLNYRVITSGHPNQATAYSMAYDEVNQHVLITAGVLLQINIVGDTIIDGGSSYVQLIRFNKQLVYQSHVGFAPTYTSPIIARNGFVYIANNYNSNIRKIDVNNQTVWTLPISSGAFSISSLYLSEHDTLYAIGYFMNSGFPNDPVTYGSVSIQAPAAGNYSHIGFFKIDSSGNAIQGKYLCEGTSTGNLPLIAADAQENVYVFVPYNIGNQTIGTHTLTTPTSANDAFVVKFNNALQAQWVTELHNTSANMESRTLEVNNTGKVLITGMYGANATFGTYDMPGVPFNSCFLAQLDQASGNIIYATQFGALQGTGRPLTMTKQGDKYYIGGLSYSGLANTSNYGCYHTTFVSQFLTCFTDSALMLPTPNLQYLPPVLLSNLNSPGAIIKWFKDGVEIPGANGTSIIPTGNGVYSIDVNYYGCLASDNIQLTNVSASDISAEHTVFIYPNPAADKVFVQFPTTSLSLASVQLFNMTGVLLYDAVIPAGEMRTDINVHQVQPGLYLLKVITDKGCVTQQVHIIK